MSAPENISPEQLPDPWLADSVWLLEELAKTRETILRIPFSLNNASDIKCAIDRIFSLEQTLTFLLKLRTEGQSSFAARAEKQGRAAARPMPPAAPSLGERCLGGTVVPGVGALRSQLGQAHR
jgi:hypothetical protein